MQKNILVIQRTCYRKLFLRTLLSTGHATGSSFRTHGDKNGPYIHLRSPYRIYGPFTFICYFVYVMF